MKNQKPLSLDDILDIFDDSGVQMHGVSKRKLAQRILDAQPSKGTDEIELGKAYIKGRKDEAFHLPTWTQIGNAITQASGCTHLNEATDAVYKLIYGKPCPKCEVCDEHSVVFQGENGFRCEDHVLFGESKGMVEKEINGDTSDGYHTFNELYDHRCLLWINYCLLNFDKCYLVPNHFEGWFLLGMKTAWGQISYHCPNKYYAMVRDFKIEHPEFDGHTPKDVIDRLTFLIAYNQPKDAPKEGSSTEEEIKSALSFLLEETPKDFLGREAAIHGTYLRIAKLSANTGLVKLCRTEVYNKLWDMTEGLELSFHRCKSNQESRDVRNSFINRLCEWLDQYGTPPSRVPSCEEMKSAALNKMKDQSGFAQYNVFQLEITCEAVRQLILKGRG